MIRIVFHSIKYFLVRANDLYVSFPKPFHSQILIKIRLLSVNLDQRVLDRDFTDNKIHFLMTDVINQSLQVSCL